MLEKIKLLLGITNNEQNNLISLLIQMAIDEAVSYCHLDSYDTSLDTTVIKMVVEMYNKLGSEGSTNEVFASGVSSTYLSDYSDAIITNLKKHRRLILL